MVSKRRWPEQGPVRDLLAYLEQLHRDQGRPPMTELGRVLSLTGGTVSEFFTGARLIGRDHLRKLVNHLGGDAGHAERLWRAARSARDGDATADRPTEPPRTDAAPVVVGQADATTRLDVLVFGAPVNRLNRPEQMIGRQSLIDTVNGLLDSGGRVLLHGIGGCGKTALAATIADRRVDAGQGPYLWLRTAAADAESALDALARCLTAASGSEDSVPPAGDARLLAIARLVGTAQIGLCVVDDVWNPATLHAVLRALPTEIPVLVTSRLKIGLEHQVEVEGLDETEATRLLAHHARDEKFTAHPDAVALCRELSNHPYLIEIAGHHLRQYSLTPRQLRRLVAGAPHDLQMPAGFAAPGRENARRLLDATHERLPHDDARAAVAAVGELFSGSVTPELLAQFLGIGFNRTLSALNALVDASLAKRAPGAGAYTVHDLTMAYARTALRDSGDSGKRAIAAVRDFVLAHRDDHDVLARDLDNIVAGAELARESAADDFLTVIETVATCGYLDTHGHTLPLLRLIDDAIQVVRGIGDPVRLHYLLSKRGNAAYNRAELEPAVAFYREALKISPTPRRRMILLGVIGKVLAVDGEHTESEACFTEAYDIAHAEADEAGTVRILEQHSVAAQRDYARVREIAERGVELSRRLGDRALEAAFLNNLGTAHFELGVEAGRRYHHEAMAIAEESSNEKVLAVTHHNVGIDYHALERFDEARAHLTEALHRYERLGEVGRAAKVRALMQRFGYLAP